MQPCVHRTYDKRLIVSILSVFAAVAPPLVRAQGTSPENGATLFPGGAALSCNSVFTTRKQVRILDQNSLPPGIRPTFEHKGSIILGWGFRRDFQLSAIIPIISHHLDLRTGGTNLRLQGTGLGDVLLLLKYRLLRRDSGRGTTQISLTAGPKLPTGRTDLRDSQSALLPAGLQPGSGSTDLFLGASVTYTGLFKIKRLVADGTCNYMHTTEGVLQTRLGDSAETRFWLSYRPYQSRGVGKEWFIGPFLSWAHAQRDSRAGIVDTRSGGDALFAGITNYFSPHAGWTLWLSLDFPVVQNTNGMPLENKRQINFGVTKQIVLHR